ncbi:MAG: MFS transporter [Pseudonocardiaceae bacterium]
MFSGVLQLSFAPLYPLLGQKFQVDVATLSWALIVFTLAGVLSTPLFAKLGDVYGHLRVLRVEVGLVALGCTLIAVAPNFTVLVIGRFLQGTFPAFLPLMFGLVRSRFETGHTNRAIAYLSSILLFGTLLGAVLTGVLVQAAGGPEWALWLPAFGTIIGFGLLWLCRAGSTAHLRMRVDWLGALLLGVGLTALLVGIEQGHHWGWISAVVLACLVAGILIIVGWVVVELRAADPVADLRFLFRPRLLPIYIVGITIYFGDVGGQVTLSTYLSLPQDELGYGLGLDAFEISVVFIPMRAAAARMAMLTARLGRTFGFRWAMAAGAAMAALGALGYPVFHTTATGFVTCAVIFLAGFGLIEGSTRTLVVGNLRHWETSMGQGIYEMCAVIGGAIGAATLGAILGANTAAGSNVPTEHGYMLAWSSVAALALVATIVAVIYAAAGAARTW